MKKSIAIFKFLALFLVLVFVISCNSSNSKNSSFEGNEQAVSKAEDMFNAIGGKTAWCELQSLYIKAKHTEPQMEIPYQSEIWRGIDKFEVVIEQQNDSFHVKGVFDETAGTIRYYDKRDTSRTLTAGQLKDWEFDHNHNVYVLLHNLGCNPQNYKVELDEEDKLIFYKDSTYVVAFGLDEKNRPHLFYPPNSDGTISGGSMFSHWGTDGGLTHSAGGHPLDSNFMYRTEIWQPSNKSLKEAFGEDIFGLE